MGGGLLFKDLEFVLQILLQILLHLRHFILHLRLHIRHFLLQLLEHFHNTNWCGGSIYQYGGRATCRVVAVALAGLIIVSWWSIHSLRLLCFTRANVTFGSTFNLQPLYGSFFKLRILLFIEPLKKFLVANGSRRILDYNP